MQRKRLTIIHVFLIPSMIILFASCAEQSGQPPLENVEETVIALERQVLDRWSDGDPMGFAANCSEDVTYFDDIAAHARLDSITEVQEYFTMLSGNIPKHQYELADTKVQVYGDVAILTLHYLSKSPEGEDGPPWKATSVYHYKDGNWKVVHAHWSLVKMQEEKEAEPEI